MDHWSAQLQDVQLHNASAALAGQPPFSSFHPCALFAIRDGAGAPIKPHIILAGGTTFVPVWTRDEVTIYAPQATASYTPAVTGIRWPMVSRVHSVNQTPVLV